jgi:hypothetical protein
VKWVPVRVKKTRQNENLEAVSNLIRTELQGGKLQNFAGWSYRFACFVRVFHARQPVN